MSILDTSDDTVIGESVFNASQSTVGGYDIDAYTVVLGICKFSNISNYYITNAIQTKRVFKKTDAI